MLLTDVKVRPQLLQMWTCLQLPLYALCRGRHVNLAVGLRFASLPVEVLLRIHYSIIYPTRFFHTFNVLYGRLSCFGSEDIGTSILPSPSISSPQFECFLGKLCQWQWYIKRFSCSIGPWQSENLFKTLRERTTSSHSNCPEKKTRQGDHTILCPASFAASMFLYIMMESWLGWLVHFSQAYWREHVTLASYSRNQRYCSLPTHRSVNTPS